VMDNAGNEAVSDLQDASFDFACARCRLFDSNAPFALTSAGDQVGSDAVLSPQSCVGALLGWIDVDAD
jgi:hypothetical protein